MDGPRYIFAFSWRCEFLTPSGRPLLQPLVRQKNCSFGGAPRIHRSSTLARCLRLRSVARRLRSTARRAVVGRFLVPAVVRHLCSERDGGETRRLRSTRSGRRQGPPARSFVVVLRTLSALGVCPLGAHSIWNQALAALARCSDVLSLF